MGVGLIKYHWDQVTANENQVLKKELANSFVNSINFLEIPISFIECPALSIT